MLTYDYLKENPQLRHQLIQTGWADLFTDSNTPYAVKEELKEIMLYDTTPSDSLLFWHQYYKMYQLTENDRFKLESYVWSSPWLEQLYTVIQQDVESFNNYNLIKACWRVIINMDTVTCAYRCILDEVKMVISLMSNYVGVTHSICIVYAMINIPFTSSGKYSKDYALILKCCTPRLIRSLRTEQQLNNVYDLLSDTTHVIGHVFDSINEIQRVHDERTEREVEALMKTCEGKSYVYDDTFRAIVEKHNMFLPLGPSSLVERGKQHHNCVGTYDARHLSNLSHDGKGEVMRLIFSKTATIELKVQASHGLIVSTEVGQCKGQNNKNIEHTEDLTRLRIDLVGCGHSILWIDRREE